jgi:hypothetical protein
MDGLDDNSPAGEDAIPGDAIATSVAAQAAAQAEPTPAITDGGKPLVTETPEPKGPTLKEKQEKALAGIKEKWDALKSRDESESLYTDGMPADDAQSDETPADAGTDGSAAKDVQTDDFDQRRELAEVYGVNVEQLAGFATAKDAEKALVELDRLAFTGQLAQQAGQPNPQAPPDGDGETELTPEQARDLGLDLSEWSEDEPIRKNLSVLEQQFLKQQALLQQAIARLDSAEIERQQQVIQHRITTFHSTLDSLDESLYGKSGDATPQQMINRNYLQSQVAQAAQALEMQGIPVPQDVARFVTRVHRNLFGGRSNAQHAAASQKPPAKPRPQLGAPGRSQPRTKHPSGSITDFKGDPRENPRVHELYEQLAEKSQSGY